MISKQETSKAITEQYTEEYTAMGIVKGAIIESESGNFEVSEVVCGLNEKKCISVELKMVSGQQVPAWHLKKAIESGIAKVK